MMLSTCELRREIKQFMQDHKNFNDESFYFLRYYKNLSFFEHMSFYESVCYVLGISIKKGNKALKKAFYSSFQKAIDSLGYYTFEADYLLAQSFQNSNYLIPLIGLTFLEKMKLFPEHITEEQINCFWNFLQRKFSEKYLFKLIYNTCTQDDTIPIYSALVTLYLEYKFLLDENFTPTKKVSMVRLHEQFQNIIHKHISERSAYYYQETDLLGEGSFGHLRFQLPNNSKELYSWAQKLDNCLFSYAHKIAKECLIYGVFQSNTLLYAIELRHYSIVQMSGYQNQAIPSNDAQMIEKWKKFSFNSIEFYW